MPSPARTALVLLAVAATTVVAWFGWLGWEAGYRTLPDGTVTGPYSTVQVVGCAVTIAGIVVAGCLTLRCAARTSAAVIACATVSFAAVWARDAASRDETGLWAVGLVFLVVGAVAGLAVVAVLTRLVRDAVLRRRA
ncbi:hypothetical protein ACIBED_04850 [Rhodococcus coprophilus]|uniref:Transmembrane protein n=1 Tax=Rhodococcus coprophilus TaxID=38310 RepID=A0A2X4UM36_9NOCA|nr:hypothetical protein [Rhodococcus coprophilus]MBM7460402.1 hypothetical protein [Rhodococcus coprophilus]SQI39659.1 Uncharacterised protein [Rhodococcus coprophilus]